MAKGSFIREGMWLDMHLGIGIAGRKTREFYDVMV
tara:strand:+ start:1391 stop:1495 length:105 start_codon:yes stop_codon:yes gene_type:complete